jgi:dTDP-4-dehydrorhamnose reductase
MRLLLFGSDGQLGSRLETDLAALGSVCARSGKEFDLRDSERVIQLVRDERPDAIVNAAAYTAVDKAESEEDVASAVNAEAPHVLAEAARETGALLVQYSTDYVFDGSARVPYTEDAPAAPLGVYGRTKFAGEEAIRKSGCRHLILRTAWLYSNRGHNFLNTMLRLSEARDEIRVVNDQRGAPTCADDVSAATVAVLRELRQGGGFDLSRTGTYHMTNAGECSWYDFARAIMRIAHRATRVMPITSAEYPTPARRPAYSVLSSEKLARAFGIRLAPWETALANCLAARVGAAFSRD